MEIAQLYSQPKRDQNGPSKSLSHLGYANTANREIDLQLLRQGQLHSSLHSAMDCHMWSIVQALKEKHQDRMDSWMPSGIWQDKAVYIEPSCSSSHNTGIYVDPLPSYIRNLHGLHVRPSNWARLERKGDLLLKQEVHQLWDQLHRHWKDMLCLSIGITQVVAIYALLHHKAYFLHGSH